MSLIASATTKACFAWMLFYVFFGASQTGKDFISDVVSSWMKDSKGGVPLVMLAFPVLIATSVCSLLNVRSSRRTCLCPPKSNRWKVGPFRSIFQLVLGNHGDGNFDLYALIFLLFPLFVYACLGIHRRTVRLEVNLPMLFLGLQSLDEDTSSELAMGVGNAFGMTAIVAMAFFLLPASKHGPLMKLFGWSHAMAIRLHIWCGRAMVVTAFLHGMFHTLRWKYQLGEDFQTFFFPPRQCWTREEDFAPTCKNPDSDCTCYDHFLSFSGTLAVSLLLVIFITSSNWVRRKSYSVFLASHLLVGPLFIFVVIFHYNSAVLYMAPSLLYYVATSLPPYFERRRNVGVHVLSVDVIGTTTASNKYVSLTFEATRETVQAFRPGMYTKLSVPSISNVAHPFTINRVPGKDDRLRVIFRVTGPFTRQLAVLLEAESGIPTMHLHGLHGCPSRMHQLRHHDVNILVAGGIGITPFLSLIGDAVATNGEDGKIHPHHRGSRMQCLELHWMCRDSSLIKYVRREYLDPLDGCATPTCDTQIQIHQTGDAANEDVVIRTLAFPSDTVQVTEPFRISRFAPSTRVFSNLGPFLALVSILWPGLAVLWYCYTNLQAKEEMSGRAFAPIFLLLYSSVVSYVSARILPYGWFGKSSPEEDFKIREDSDHSYEETLPLSLSPSAGHLARTMDDDEESPHQNVTLECISGGRPDLDILLESVDTARWPAIFSCGPLSMSESLQTIVSDKSVARSAVEPSRSSPVVTIYSEVFLM